MVQVVVASSGFSLAKFAFGVILQDPARTEYRQGNARSAIYKESADYEMFLDVLERVEARFNWLCHAYCLPGNHYHLMIETPDWNLAAGISWLFRQFRNQANKLCCKL